MAALNICIVGAPYSGRTRLSVDLDVTLASASQDAVFTVTDCAAPGNHDLIFLMGLDQASASGEHVDRRVRATLMGLGVPFTVLYGSPDERLSQALVTIEKLLAVKLVMKMSPQVLTAEAAGPARSRPWTWACDKCSDPQCEHKLLTDLLAARVANQPIGALQAVAVAGQGG